MGYGFGLNDSFVDEYTPFPSSSPTGAFQTQLIYTEHNINLVDCQHLGLGLNWACPTKLCKGAIANKEQSACRSGCMVCQYQSKQRDVEQFRAVGPRHAGASHLLCFLAEYAVCLHTKLIDE